MPLLKTKDILASDLSNCEGWAKFAVDSIDLDTGFVEISPARGTDRTFLVADMQRFELRTKRYARRD